MTSRKESSVIRLGAYAGISIPILFTILVIIESSLRPGYSQISDEISLLGVGSYQQIQNFNFIVSGILSLVFAFGLTRAINENSLHKKRRLLGALILFGFGIIVAGVSLLLASPYPESSSIAIHFYYIHTIFSLFAFVSAIFAQFLTWRALTVVKNIQNWKSFRTFSLISGIISVALLILFLVTSSSTFDGLTERLFAAVVLLWIELGGIKLLNLTRKNTLPAANNYSLSNFVMEPRLLLSGQIK